MTKAISRFILVFMLALVGISVTGDALAAVKTKAISYKDGNLALRGTIAWDDAIKGKRPGVLIVHEWWGLDDYARGRAKQLAAAGYVAFALDMYGVGKITNHAKEAGEWAKQVNNNIDRWVGRAKSGLDILKADANVDDTKVAAIGYCFGGSTVMQMAYAGLGVKAVTSFHGSLPPASEAVTEIKPRVLIAHGRDDKFIPADRIVAFKAGLDRAKADWEMMEFSNTVHSFTNPESDTRGMKNIRYNPRADKHSWAAMLLMFDEVFK
jgi:dienelactone hydrolase